MTRTNYHTHNNLCDGHGSIEEYIEMAVQRGMTALGFSSHAPIPVANAWTLTQENLHVYLCALDTQKEKWKQQIQIYKGLEIDYIPGSQSPNDVLWGTLGLDYAIGSVHSTTGLDRNPTYNCVDGPVKELQWLLENIHDASFEKLSEAYYTRVGELVRMGGFTFLGHLDLIKKRNQNGDFFSESALWYKRHITTVLDIIANSGIILEVNTGAISRGVLNSVYPSPWILADAFKRNIPVVINADAHAPENVDFYFDESQALLRDCGYTKAWALLDCKWTAVPL